ncbi:MAG: FAD-binding oxidoreductase [Actinomycetota bacterium]|nr:FAD-binding oxidoreductase [Actinomycetota bacterium]
MAAASSAPSAPDRPGSAPTPEALSRLDELLGPGQVLIPGRDDIIRYDTDVLGRRSPACWVARPNDLEDVRSIVRWAYAERAELVVQGANTGPVLAGVPRAGRHQGIVSMELCRSTIDVDVLNRTVTASAGVDLASLNDALARSGLTLPIDLGANPSVGGMVAANTGGARLIRHGDVRRHVLGLEVVLPDAHATVLPLLRRLRKDNRGPDLKHLFIGSSGTLGIITAAVLAVDPLPRDVATALVAANDGSGVLHFLTLLEARAVEHLSAYELLSRPTLEAISRHLPSGIRWPFEFPGVPDLPPFLILVELSASDSAHGGRQSLEDDLTTLIDQSASRGWVADAWFGRPTTLWPLRHAAINALHQEGPMVAFDLSVPRSQLFETRDQIIALVADRAPHARYADFGHVGDGGLHSVFIWPRELRVERRLREQERLREAMYELIAAADGTFSAEHGLGPENESAFRRYSPEIRHAQAALKALFDPRRILGSVDLS